METYRIEDLTFSYPEQQRKVLNNISFLINEGDFVVLCGSSGCGKTTLLKHLKTILSPHGKKSGEIYFENIPLEKLNQRQQSSKIGFVLQSPDNQIVTDKVWHELAFGLESLGYKTPFIRLKVSEMASYFGIQNWFYKNASELSGGQKQLLNLASIMTMHPSVLILDEPTSQLDPIAAAEFLATIGKLNRELGITVIMTEHRLEEAMPLANRVLVMDEGQLIFQGSPSETGDFLKKNNHGMFLAMPVPIRICGALDNNLSCPVTVREGREWLEKFAEGKELKELPPAKELEIPSDQQPLISMEEVWFRYTKDGKDIIKDLSMDIYQGEFYAILGGNGTGKTTTLSLLAGFNKPYRGKISIMGKELTSKLLGKGLGILPQNPQSLFVGRTVKVDLLEALSETKLSRAEKEKKIINISNLCRISELWGNHPYDLSGGEQQRAAIAKVLLLEPSIIFLDEPTKGMDSEFKQIFAGILEDLLKHKVTILMVSHDIEFCASYAHRCALFFDGSIVSSNVPKLFFAGNNFYTTAANRMSRHLLPQVVTVSDIIYAFNGKDEERKTKDLVEISFKIDEDGEEKDKEIKRPKNIFKISFFILGLIMFFTSLFSFLNKREVLKQLLIGGEEASKIAADTSVVWTYVLLLLLMVTGLSSIIWSLKRGPDNNFLILGGQLLQDLILPILLQQNLLEELSQSYT